MIIKLLRYINIPIWKFIRIQLTCLLFMAAYTISSILFPGAISKIIDKGLLGSDLRAIFTYLAVLVLSGFSMVIFQYLQITNFAHLGQTIVTRLKEKLFGKIFRVNMEFWKKHSIGNVIHTIEQDVIQVENVFGSAVGRFIVNILMIIGILGILLYMNLNLGLVMILVSLLFAGAQSLIGRSVQKSTMEIRKEMGELSSFTNESVSRVNDVIVSGYSKRIKDVFALSIQNIKTKNIAQSKKVALSSVAGNFYSLISTLVALVFGADAVLKGTLGVGDIFAIIMYVQKLYSPLITLGDSYLNIKKTLPYIERILGILDSAEEILSGEYIPRKQLFGDIAFEHVCFEYSRDKVIFRNLNFSLPGGKFIGLVGDNGSGKTTIVRLLTKLYTVKKGKICIDGIEIEKFNNDFLYTQVGIMLQNNYFMSGTLRNIVNPNKLSISDTVINDLFLRVGIPMDLFEEGLDTKVHENNINISGGEAQKINIVRLLIENKPIIILDEPTAALDSESETEICRLLQNLFRGKTVISITHRVKILEICDCIYRLDQEGNCYRVEEDRLAVCREVG